MKRIIILSAVIISLVSSLLAAEDLAIVGGRVVVGNGQVFDPGVVVISNGRITSVTEGTSAPEGARVIDATGKVVWPGMIDPYSALGMVEVGADSSTNDANENTGTNTAHMRAVDGINPDSAPIAVTRRHGITTALVVQGDRNPINGQAAIIDLAGRTVDEMLIKSPAAIVFNFGSQLDGSYPSTRPGNVAFIRQTLYDAQAYAAKNKKSDSENNEDGKEDPKPPKVDLKNAALASALAGELPVFASASSIQEISSAFAVAKEFNLSFILVSPREGWKLLDQIKASGFPVLYSSTMNLPAETDPYDRYYSYAAALAKASIPFAFTTLSSHSVLTLPNQAAMSMTYGLDEAAAVRALTLEPARILGIDKDYGSLEDGKVANVVVWSGDPLQIRSKVENLFIRGNEISLRSHWEELRDRYKDLGSLR